jgi:hypothetical protein
MTFNHTTFFDRPIGRSETVVIKRGDTLNLHCAVRVGSDSQSTVGWEIESWIRDRSAVKVHDFEVTRIDDTKGRYDIKASASETINWPVGDLNCDIRYQFPDDVVVRTHTFTIRVVDSVTTP